MEAFNCTLLPIASGVSVPPDSAMSWHQAPGDVGEESAKSDGCGGRILLKPPSWFMPSLMKNSLTYANLILCEMSQKSRVTTLYGWGSRKRTIHLSSILHHRVGKRSENYNVPCSKGEGRDYYSSSEIQAAIVPDFFHLSQGTFRVQTSLFSGIIPLSSWFQPLAFGSCLWVILPVSKEWYVLASTWL